MLRTKLNRHGSVSLKIPAQSPGLGVGLLGGSFNPPHAGHVLISEIAIRRLRLDRLWWLVTPGNPLKSVDELPSIEERMAQCRKIATNPRIDVLDLEVQIGTPYTAATLSFLVRRFPNMNFIWIMGADNLVGFHRWQHWTAIARLVPIAVIDRPGYRLKGVASKSAVALARARRSERLASELVVARPPAWTYLSGPLSTLSSTELRRRKRM